MAVFTVFKTDSQPGGEIDLQTSSLTVDFYLQAQDTAVCLSLYEKLCTLGLDAETHVLAVAYVPNPERAQEIPWFNYSLYGRSEGVTMKHLENVLQIQACYGEEIHLQDKTSPDCVIALNSREDGVFRDGANKELYSELIIEARTIDGGIPESFHRCGFVKVPEPTKGGMKA